MLESGPLHLRARRWRPSSRRPPPTSACRTRSASPTAPTRSCSRSRRWASARGDEVICPSFTFYATAESIARVGATPVFADIDPATMNLDVDDVAARITPRTKAIMPVHLFGRPAPLAELAALGLPLIEDAAQAFGAEGTGTTGVCSTLQLLPDQEPLRARRRRPGRLHERRGRRAASGCCASTARSTSSTSSSSARTRGSTRSRPPRCASSCRSSPAGTPPGARPPRATPSSASATPSSCPPTSRATSTTCTSSARPTATASPPGCRRPGSPRAAYYVDADAPPAGDALPRLGTGLAAGDGARRRREPRAADVGRHRRRRAGARRRDGARRRGRRAPATMRLPLTRHRLWQVAADAAIVALAWVASWYVRFDGPRPGLLRPLPRLGYRRARRRDQAAGLRRLRLLQPLVALRLDARHVERGARRPRGLGRRLPRLRALRVHKAAVPARDLDHRPAALHGPRRRARACWRGRSSSGRRRGRSSRAARR